MAVISVRVSRRRRLRRGRIERGHDRNRLKRLARWLDARAADASAGGIGDTAGAPLACVADNTLNDFNDVAHGLADGAGPYRIAAAALPAGIDADRAYFIIENNANDFQLTRSRKNGVNQVSVESFTTNGTTVTYEVGANDRSIYALVQNGRLPVTVQAATDIDNLVF